VEKNRDKRFKLKFQHVICTLERPGNITEFAREIGVSRQIVYKWLSGRHIPSQYHIEKVEAYLSRLSDEKYHQARLLSKRAEQLKKIHQKEETKAKKEQARIDEKEKLWEDICDQNKDEDDESSEIIY